MRNGYFIYLGGLPHKRVADKVLTRSATKRLRSRPDLVPDAVQVASVRLTYMSPEKAEAVRDVEPYAAGVVRRVAQELLDEDGRYQGPADGKNEPAVDPRAAIERLMFAKKFLAELDRALNSRQKQILNLIYQGWNSNSAIARELKLSRTTVIKNRSRIIEIIKSLSFPPDDDGGGGARSRPPARADPISTFSVSSLVPKKRQSEKGDDENENGSGLNRWAVASAQHGWTVASAQLASAQPLEAAGGQGMENRQRPVLHRIGDEDLASEIKRLLLELPGLSDSSERGRRKDRCGDLEEVVRTFVAQSGPEEP